MATSPFIYEGLSALAGSALPPALGGIVGTMLLHDAQKAQQKTKDQQTENTLGQEGKSTTPPVETKAQQVQQTPAPVQHAPIVAPLPNQQQAQQYAAIIQQLFGKPVDPYQQAYQQYFGNPT